MTILFNMFNILPNLPFLNNKGLIFMILIICAKKKTERSMQSATTALMLLLIHSTLICFTAHRHALIIIHSFDHHNATHLYSL